MNLSYAKGERVLLTDNCSQTFFGVIKSINADLGRILLTDIVLLPERKSISGYRHFDKDEIVQIKKYEGDMFDGNGADDCDLERRLDILTPKLSESKYEEIQKLQGEYRFVRDFGTNFHSAISLLRSCDRIGVYGKDVSKGRLGRISVLAISSPSNVFVFDLEVLGDEVFLKGLKEILESPKTIKVVHDCRLLSDCLKHKHLIGLENVRDVEAEDVMVVFQERRTIRKHSRPLEYLVKVYLGVETEGCNADADSWSGRPLAPNLLEVLVSFASLLLPLQEAIERRYLQLLVDASNLYNGHARDLDFFDLLYDDPKKTLRKQICKLLMPRNEARGDCRPKKVS